MISLPPGTQSSDGLQWSETSFRDALRHSLSPIPSRSLLTAEESYNRYDSFPACSSNAAQDIFAKCRLFDGIIENGTTPLYCVVEGEDVAMLGKNIESLRPRVGLCRQPSHSVFKSRDILMHFMDTLSLIHLFSTSPSFALLQHHVSYNEWHIILT